MMVFGCSKMCYSLIMTLKVDDGNAWRWVGSAINLLIIPYRIIGKYDRLKERDDKAISDNQINLVPSIPQNTPFKVTQYPKVLCHYQSDIIIWEKVICHGESMNISEFAPTTETCLLLVSIPRLTDLQSLIQVYPLAGRSDTPILRTFLIFSMQQLKSLGGSIPTVPTPKS